MPGIRFRLNGAETEIDANPDFSLLSVLRGPLGMTGPHSGCGANESAPATSWSVCFFAEGGPIFVSLGKVEIGQGTVTELAQIAADELDVDIRRVRMVSGIDRRYAR